MMVLARLTLLLLALLVVVGCSDNLSPPPQFEAGTDAAIEAGPKEAGPKEAGPKEAAPKE